MLILPTTRVNWPRGRFSQNIRDIPRNQRLCIWIILPNYSYNQDLQKLAFENLQEKRAKPDV